MKLDIDDQDVTWCESNSKILRDNYDLVIDCSKNGNVTVLINDATGMLHGPKQGEIEIDQNNIQDMLEQLISIFVSEQIVDIDWEDIMKILSSNCKYKFLLTSNASSKEEVGQWVRYNIPKVQKDMLIYITGDLTLFEVSEILEKFDFSEVEKEKVIYAVSSISHDNSDTVKISIWY